MNVLCVAIVIPELYHLLVTGIFLGKKPKPLKILLCQNQPNSFTSWVLHYFLLLVEILNTNTAIRDFHVVFPPDLESIKKKVKKC